MSNATSGVPVDPPRTWAVPRSLKEGFVALAVIALVGLGIFKAVQHFGGAAERAKSAVQADSMDRVPPPLKLSSRSGAVVDLTQYRGKAVLVHFWATWCPPCVAELPVVEKVAQRFDPATLQVLAVSVDETWDPVDKFISKNSVLNILLDPNAATSRAFGTTQFPESYLVDKEGRIRLKFVGSRNWLDPNMAEVFDSYGVKPKS